MDIENIERVQIRATRMIQQLKNSSFEARLRRLNRPTLKYRRLRGDVIQVYNIVSGKYTTNPTVDFNLSNVFNTRGNIYKMQLTHMHYNLRKLFLVIELSQYGIVFLTILLMQSLLTYLKIDWIDSGLIKKLNLIGMLTLPELEVEV